MNTNYSYKITFTCFLLLVVSLVTAQSKTTTQVTADRNKILIGEQINLTLRAEVPINEPIRFFVIDTIPHFEILERQKIDSSDTDDGTVLTQVIRITSFDSGHWVIPPFVLSEGVSTDSISVDVGFTEGFNPDQDYHDIKDIIEVTPVEKKDKWWLWYAIGAGVVLIGFIVFLILRKKKPVAPAAAVVADPYQEAMEKLDKLQRHAADPKPYYSALVDIFRVYVLKKKGIHSLQKTTDDLVVQLRGIALDKELFERLSQVLRLSDYVKFAKYTPSLDDDRNALDTIRKAISGIEQTV